MKAREIVFLVLGVVLGGIMASPAKPVHAQSSTPLVSGTCQWSTSAAPVVTCGQYVVQVTDERGFGRFEIWQVQGPAISVWDNGYSFVSGGNSPVSTQVFEPGNRASETMTLTAQEP